MKKRTYFYLCMSLAFLCITGCTGKSNQETTITPSLVIKEKENEAVKIQGTVFKEKEKSQEKEESKNKEEKKPTSNIITKTDGLCEQLETVETDVALYNSFNRMLGAETSMGVENYSIFCLDERTGVVYFVNQQNDNFLYRMKDGEVVLAVAMPMKQLYPYDGSVYFMVDDYGIYQLEGMNTGDIYCYTPSTGAVQLVYPVGAMAKERFENVRQYKLLVEESGIYFGYEVIGEDSVVHTYCYALPFGASEPLEDTRCTAEKGWNEYYFGPAYRVPEDGTYEMQLINRETGEKTVIPARGSVYCVIGDVLYYADFITLESLNLATGERISYDFTKAAERRFDLEHRSNRVVNFFTITEDAFWVSTRCKILRVDLQTKEMTWGTIQGKDKTTYYYVQELFTDGKEVYALTERYMTGVEKGMVRLVFTEEKDIFGDSIIKFEYLTE